MPEEHECWKKGTKGEPCWGDVSFDPIGYTDDGDDAGVYACEGHSRAWGDGFTDGPYIPQPSNAAKE